MDFSCLKPDIAIARKPGFVDCSNSSAKLNGGFIFYSNNPESVLKPDTVLSRATAKGIGQIYSWHVNKTGSRVTSAIRIHNRNNVAIKVSVGSLGLTNAKNESDIQAWYEYFEPMKLINLVLPGSYVDLFVQYVQKGFNFGVISKINITDTDGSPVEAEIEDIVYAQSSNAELIDHAIENLNRRSGIGYGYKSMIDFGTVGISGAKDVAYKLACKDSCFNGKERPYINAWQGNINGLLEGGYGQIFSISIAIRNDTGKPASFAIYLGSNGGNAFPLIYYRGDIIGYKWLKPFRYLDVIRTEMLPVSGVKQINFKLVIPAMTSAPYVIGIRKA